MLATLIELVPYDPVTAGTVTLRACSADDAALTSLNGTVWWPAIARRPRLTVDGFDGNFGGQITTGAGDVQLLTIPTGTLAVFADAPRYEWSDKRARIWTGQIGAAWGSFTLLFDGLVQGNAKVARGRVSLGLRVNDSFLDRPLLNLTYGGTGGSDGPAALKGTPKPLIIGAPQFVEPVLIDAVNNVHQLSGYGAIHGVTALFDRLVAFGASTGNYANYAALVAASIPSGGWGTCLAEGLVRLGAPPAGTLTAHVEGDSGSAYGWVRKPGAVISRLASIAGASGGQIDATSMTALDTAVPYNLSYSFQSQVTARDIIQTIAASANAAAGVSWLGKLYAAPVAIGTSALTLKSDGTALPPVAAVESLGTAAPYWRMQMAAAITWRVHGSGDYGIYDYAEVGGTKPPSDATRNVKRGAWSSSSVAYIIGDQVDNQNTTWESLTAHTSSAGNGPPTLPTTSNTNWRLAAALDYSAVAGTKPPSNADNTASQAIVSRLSSTTGQALDTFVLSNGINPASIVASGLNRDGDAVTFPTALASVPKITFLPGGNTGTAGQNIFIQALGLSASGFTMKAKSQSVTPGSTIADLTVTSGGGANPDLMINRSNAGHPFDSRFRFNFTVTVGDISPGNPGTIVIAAYAKISGSWSEVARGTYGADGGYVLFATLASVDFGGGDEFGIDVVSATGSGTALSSFDGVIYTLGSITETSLTPTGASDIPWIAIL